jgi:hypothetical protein
MEVKAVWLKYDDKHEENACDIYASDSQHNALGTLFFPDDDNIDPYIQWLGIYYREKDPEWFLPFKREVIQDLQCNIDEPGTTYTLKY